jgi:hypothetical protein
MLYPAELQGDDDTGKFYDKTDEKCKCAVERGGKKRDDGSGGFETRPYTTGGFCYEGKRGL